MELEFTAEIWNVLRNHIDIHDRDDAAADLVTLLIDNDHDPMDIKEAFRGDSAITDALHLSDVEDDEGFGWD